MIVTTYIQRAVMVEVQLNPSMTSSELDMLSDKLGFVLTLTSVFAALFGVYLFIPTIIFYYGTRLVFRKYRPDLYVKTENAIIACIMKVGTMGTNLKSRIFG